VPPAVVYVEAAAGEDAHAVKAPLVEPPPAFIRERVEIAGIEA
jgi:hypothetical protein